MTLSKFIVKQLTALTLSVVCLPQALAAPTYGFSVRMSGWPDSTESYAFAFPAFTFTNLSSPGITITSLSMSDGGGVAGGLWDYVGGETASAGVGYTLTQGDYNNDSGWSSTIAYSLTGLDSGKLMSFYLDPDTLHGGTGNVVDARPYVFAGGTAQATFSNGESILLTWNNPAFFSFDPLRLPNASPSDNRNIYYEMSQIITPTDPQQDLPVPGTLYLLGLGLLGLAGVRLARAGIWTAPTQDLQINPAIVGHHH
jgi:hypothetical protein